MMTNDTKYTLREIVLATGLPEGKVYYRAQTLKIVFPCTYDQVKEIMQWRPKVKVTRESVINQLKLKLKNDGFKVVMDK